MHKGWLQSFYHLFICLIRFITTTYHTSWWRQRTIHTWGNKLSLNSYHCFCICLFFFMNFQNIKYLIVLFSLLADMKPRNCVPCATPWSPVRCTCWVIFEAAVIRKLWGLCTRQMLCPVKTVKLTTWSTLWMPLQILMTHR